VSWCLAVSEALAGAMATAHMEAALDCPLAVFGRTVRDVLEDPRVIDSPRDVDVVELWSGVGSVVKAAQEKGYQALPFDIGRCPGVTDVDGPFTEDIMTLRGFEKALGYVTRLRRSGLLFMAPVCSSFVFCNVSNTKRSLNNLLGDESNQSVRKGNMMANIASFLLCVALAREVHVVIENPQSSMLFKYIQPITDAFAGLQFAYADRCAYDNASKGTLTFKKPFKFLVSGMWLGQMRRCSCKDGKHSALMTKNDKGQVTGRVDMLRVSAAYPLALGEAIVRAWSTATASPSSSSTESRCPESQPKRKETNSTATPPASRRKRVKSEKMAKDENPWGSGPPSSDSEAGPW